MRSRGKAIGSSPNNCYLTPRHTPPAVLPTWSLVGRRPHGHTESGSC